MKIDPNAKIEYKSKEMEFIVSDNRYLLYRIVPSELKWWQRIFCNKWRHVKDAMPEYNPNYGKYCELYDYEEACEIRDNYKTYGEITNYLKQQVEKAQEAYLAWKKTTWDF